LKALNATVAHTNFLVNEGCSGTLVDATHVLTAAHCIVDQYQMVKKDVINEDGTVEKKDVRVAKIGTVSQMFYKGPSVVQKNSYVYKIAAADRKNDLALLKLETEMDQPAANIACTAPIVGEKIWAVGNSFAVLYSTVTNGIVSSLHRSYRDLHLQGDLGDSTDDGDHGLVQHSATIAPGNSGGALYNDNGSLVGVNVRGAIGGFSFAVPLDDVSKFLTDNGVAKDCRD
jgi:secreted trypsin-like serine protease